MRRLLILFFLFLLFDFVAPAQTRYPKNTVLITVDSDSITLGEFLDSYLKNNSLKNTTPADLEEYLELYTHFLLKVKEGKAMFLDTARNFVMELEAYKNQSAQQYLIDKDVSEKLVDEAIERTKQNLRASHILIECAPNASTADTLAAYGKALEIRNRILKGEYTFADAAVKFSEDKSARDFTDPQTGKKQHGNKGDLGYFSSFSLIYPFETGAYNTPVGEISLPVRTRFGYHLIYVVDRIPGVALINAAQIFIADDLGAEGKMSPATQEKLSQIESKLQSGTSFEELVRIYSEDEASKEKEGVLAPFSPGRRSGDFVKAALDLKPGGISKPVASPLGWHILKLIEIQPVQMDEERAYLVKTRVARDPRSHLSKNSLAEKLKKEYHYADEGAGAFIQFLADHVPAGFFQHGGVDMDSIPGIRDFDLLATFANQKIEAKAYLDFVKRFQGSGYQGEARDFFKERYDVFCENAILNYERSHLEEKYPEYKALVKEYHDGMILYEVNSKLVWNKAIQDSVGIVQFYEKIKSNYPVSESKPTRYKPLEEIRALVITEYQDALDKEWVDQLKKKYTVTVNREVFDSILKK